MMLNFIFNTGTAMLFRLVVLGSTLGFWTANAALGQAPPGSAATPTAAPAPPDKDPSAAPAPGQGELPPTGAPPVAQPSVAQAEPAAAEPGAPPAAAPAAGPAQPAADKDPAASPDVSQPAASAPQPHAPPAPVDAAPPTDSGPTLNLPPEVEDDQPAAPVPDNEEDDESGTFLDELRGLLRLPVQGQTGMGGYAELHYNLANVTGNADSQAEIDFHRFVLFVSHRFNNQLRFYAEFEVEHAIVGGDNVGEVALEQAFVDYKFLDDALGLRAGIVLIPMGITNQWHEPPMFHGVERPTVDRVIIPSTWREGGIGIFGEPSEGLRYELYVVGGLDASGFRARDGLRAGRLKVGRAAANGLAVTGRLEYEATLGLVAGVSGYVGQAGPNADFYDPTGERVELKVPVWGASADIRGRHEGLEFRGVFATFGIGDTVTLRDVADQEGENLGLDVPAQIYGGYLELGYDLLTLMSETEQQLLPFVRFERYDTMAEVAGRQEVPSDRAFGVNELFLGFSYRPLRQVVFKGDFMLRMPDGAAPDGTSNTRGDINLGMGVMF